MKEIRWTFFFILIPLLFLAACSSPVGKKIGLVNQTIKDDNYNVVYPRVVSAGPSDVRARVNSIIRDRALELMSQGTEYENASLFSTYEATLNNHPVLSLRFDESLSFYRMAHPENALRSLTVNVSNGEIYVLSDLFILGSDYHERLNELVKKDIQQRGLKLLEPFESISEGQGFYLTDDSLALYWQEYVYTTHAQGPLVVLIPCQQLKDILKKQILLRTGLPQP